MKNAIQMVSMIGLIAMTSVFAQAKTYTGVDRNGQSCQFNVDEMKISKAKKHDACFFESDGRGPWCDGKPPVFSVQISGSGAYVTAAGSVDFILDEKYAILDDSKQITGFAASTKHGGTVSVKTQDDGSWEVYYAFLTEYGQTLTPQEINAQLLKRDPNVSYQEVWNKLYTDEFCTVK